MSQTFILIAGNFAMVALVIAAWTHCRDWVTTFPAPWRHFMFGGFLGTGALLTMLMSIKLAHGVYLDLRVPLLAVAGFFGGPPAALAAAAIAIAARTFMGGAATTIGLVMIAGAVVCGLVGYGLTRRNVRSWHLAVLGLAVAITSGLSPLVAPDPLRPLVPIPIWLGMLLLSAAATFMAGQIILRARAASNERRLMVVAMAHAPDHAYVKNSDGSFAVTNEAIARLYGRNSPADMVGLTDFDVMPLDQAREGFEDEQELLRTGVPIIGLEEQVADSAGAMCWYSTSKVPLYNADGDPIGIAGVIRDVTEEKRLQRELVDSRNRLSFAMDGMSDGLALFDRDGHLLFCNEQYRQCFPLTGPWRVPGAHIRSILEKVLETGEQINIPATRRSQWMDAVIDGLRRNSEEEIHLYDGRWVHLRTRLAEDGSATVLVSDVTQFKRAESDLLSATEQLQMLADTDGLTGLVNRRAFDIALEKEVGRAMRNKAALSLLLIDVDHFKSYNDLYGHPAGDQALKQVAECLRRSAKRPGDLVARYGGEEFVVILAETDDDGAYVIAQKFRAELAALKMTHEGGGKGVLTASVGIATYVEGQYLRYPGELVGFADEALYGAKAAGRDRINGWRPTSGARRA